jgi:hypothetical protein
LKKGLQQGDIQVWPHILGMPPTHRFFLIVKYDANIIIEPKHTYIARRRRVKDLCPLLESKNDLIIQTRLNILALSTLVITLLLFSLKRAFMDISCPPNALEFFSSVLCLIKFIVRID